MAYVVSNHVREVRVHADDTVIDGAQIEILGTGAPTYNVRVAEGGRRLLIDLDDSDVIGAQAAITAPVGVVGGVLTQAYPTSTGSMTRLTVSLQREARYRVVPDGMTLRVIVAPRDANPTTAASPVARTPQSAIVVRDFRFELVPAAVAGSSPSGCDRLVVQLPSIPAYSLAPAINRHLR